MSSLYILDINPLSDGCFQITCYHSIGCLFVLLILLLCRSFFVWCNSTYLFLILLCFYCQILLQYIQTSFFFFFFFFFFIFFLKFFFFNLVFFFCPFFFVPTVCWNFSDENLDFLRGTLWWLSKTGLQGLLNWSQEGLEFVRGALQGPQDWCLSAYYPMPQWVRLLLGPLAYGAGFHNSQKVSFVRELMPDCYC